MTRRQVESELKQLNDKCDIRFYRSVEGKYYLKNGNFASDSFAYKAHMTASRSWLSSNGITLNLHEIYCRIQQKLKNTK